MLSPGAAHFVAQVLPFFELSLGLWLVSGIGRRYSSLVASLMFCGFMTAIAYAYFRGLKIKCGCGIGEDQDVGPVALLRDGLRFLLPALVVTIGAFWIRRKRRFRSIASGIRAFGHTGGLAFLLRWRNVP